MSIKKYHCKIDYTEHSEVTTESVVYAQSQEDADFIARVQFLDKRRDKPTIRSVAIKELSDSKLHFPRLPSMLCSQVEQPFGCSLNFLLSNPWT
jgi:hypothetical protein